MIVSKQVLQGVDGGLHASARSGGRRFGQWLHVHGEVVFPAEAAQPRGRVRDELATIAAPVRGLPGTLHGGEDAPGQRLVRGKRGPGLDRLALGDPLGPARPEALEAGLLDRVQLGNGFFPGGWSGLCFGLRSGKTRIHDIAHLTIQNRARRSRCATGLFIGLFLVCSMVC